MRVLIFNEHYYPHVTGGAEVSVQLLAEALMAKGIEVHICTTYTNESDENINEVPVHRIKQKNLYWSVERNSKSKFQKIIWHIIDIYNWANKSTIEGVIRKVKPDIIHTNVIAGFSVIVWSIAKNLNIPIVHTLRDYYLLCSNSTMFSKGGICKEKCAICNVITKVNKLSTKNVDAVIGISNFVLQLHLQDGLFNKAKIKSVINNSVNDPGEIDLTIERKVIGYIGRIHQSKGIEFLIESFLAIDSKEFVLKIAGNGERQYLNYLKDKYASPKVEFLGRVNCFDFLKNVNTLVVPSIWNEPFGRVVVEAFMCGCYVLVSNRGGMPELINNNGEVFDIDSSSDLQMKLSKVINGNITNVNRTIDKYIYSTAYIANKYIETYNALLKK